MSLLFQDATLVDGVAPEPRAHLDVLVQQDRIRAIGTDLSDPDARALDGTGCYLLPGLIDCHVHLCFDASPKPVDHLNAESDPTTLLKMVRHANQTLRRGVTTVRDLGAKNGLDLALRDAIARGWVAGPRMLVSGRVITITGGHCYFMGYEVDNLDEIRRAVRMGVKAGVDLIKVMATGGRLTPGSSLDRAQFSEEELRAVVAEAQMAGRRVAAHTGGLEGIRRSVAAGVTSVEHGSSMDEATMLAMKQKGTFWVPTNAPAVRVLSNLPGADFPPTYLDAVRATFALRRAATQRGIELGVRFGAGTDAGVPSTEHGGVALEVKLFAELGMPPMHAIWTATCWAAELLGLEREVGTVEVGKRADLILLSENPMDNWDALAHPELVVQNGQIVYSTGVIS